MNKPKKPKKRGPKPSKKKKVTSTKPVGRPRVCMSMREAMEFIRNEGGIETVTDYKKWWMLNKPSRIPKRPDRAYAKEFTTWANFLGTSNPYPMVRQKKLSFDEARAAMHALNFKGIEDYFECIKNRDMKYHKMKSMNIPLRPDVYYRKRLLWTTWKDYLGYNSAKSAKIDSMIKVKPILYILRHELMPPKIYKIDVVAGGPAFLKQHAAAMDMRIMMAHDIPAGDDKWKAILTKHAQKYYLGDANDWIVENPNALLFDLDNTYSRTNLTDRLID